MAEQRAWWQRGVVYQVYPRSFADADGDGVGDLHGVLHRLDHLAWLGADAVWFSPLYPSPMADFGYDVSDYCDVADDFGGLGAFEAVVAAAHERGIRVLLDWVPNHTSDQHPWFLESRSSRDSPKRSWYVWRDGRPEGGPPNNWVAAFSPDPAWTWDEATGQWYLHVFLPQQPDLNWDEPAVEAAMHDVLAFWLDMGVDGFRADVVHLIGKDPALPDLPEGWPNPVIFNDQPVAHDRLRRIRSLLERYGGDRVMVGEVNLPEPAQVAGFVRPDELHLAFNFAPLWAPWEAAAWRQQVVATYESHDAVGAWPTWVLSNHDVRRHRSRYGSEARARAAAVLLLTLRGTPFLYQGEELGLEDAEVPPDRVVDPGGRDGCRAPIPWSVAPPHGWEGEAPWLPWAPEAGRRSVEAQRADPASMVHLYRRLLATRRATSALHSGELDLLDSPDGLLAWARHAGSDTWVVAVNMSPEPVAWTPPYEVTVELDSRPEPVEAIAGVLPADTAVLWRGV